MIGTYGTNLENSNKKVFQQNNCFQSMPLPYISLYSPNYPVRKKKKSLSSGLPNKGSLDGIVDSLQLSSQLQQVLPSIFYSIFLINSIPIKTIQVFPNPKLVYSNSQYYYYRLVHCPVYSSQSITIIIILDRKLCQSPLLNHYQLLNGFINGHKIQFGQFAFITGRGKVWNQIFIFDSTLTYRRY